jgi:hypothetical protein
MRTLLFTEPELYELLYDGLLLTNRTLKAPVEPRVHSRILDKMEAVGEATERGGMVSFTLNPSLEAKVTLDDAEYKLMGECLQEVPWSARASRLVTRGLDLFEAAS